MRACAEYILGKQVGLDVGASEVRPELQVLFIEGWFDPTRGWRDFSEQLSAANPRYTVRVRRRYRRDLGFRAQLFRRRFGFIICVEVPQGENTVKLPGLSRAGGLNYSHPLVQETSAGILTSDGLESFESPGVGFIDRVWTIQLGRHGDKKLRNLQSFLESRTYKILEFLKNVKDPSRRISIAQRFVTLGLTTEVSAKFALAISPDLEIDIGKTGLALKRIAESYSVHEDRSIVPSLSDVSIGTVSAVPNDRLISAPSADVIRFENVRLQSGSTIFDENNLYVIEEAADPRHLFVSGQWDHVFGWPWSSSVLVKEFEENPEKIVRGALLSGRNDKNWYHWVIEYLPRLKSYGSLDPDLPIIVSSGMTANFRRSIEILTDRRVVESPREKSTSIGELWVSAPVVQVLDSSQVRFEDSLIANLDALSWLRTRVMNRIKPSGPRLVFLRRNSVHRGLLNERDVESALVKLGFVSVDIAKMSFEEQVSCFGAADVIVGAGGAVMANYLFAKSGAQVIALVSEASAGFVLPAVIASVAEANFAYCFGETVKGVRRFDHRLAWMHSDFTIQIADVVQSIAEYV